MGNFDQVNRLGGPANADDCPLPASLVGIFSPQDLCRTVWLGLQCVATGLGHVGKAVPSFRDIDLGGNHPIEDDPADFVVSDGFNRDTDAASVIVVGRLCRFNRGVANEAGQFHWAGVGIGEW